MNNHANRWALGRAVGLIGLSWLIFLSASLVLLFFTYQTQALGSLGELSDTILKSLRYENGRWDTTYYNADPLTPHPSGSSGFSSPLYIVTTDGFVIERNHPIAGVLDSSDFSRLRTFTSPQTITTVTNENWRVISLPIQDQGQQVGVVFVASYRPPPALIGEIDQRLLINASRIAEKVKITHGEIDTGAVDIRTIDYDLSFEVVDVFNRIHSNNGRTPSFIDVSYVATALRQPSVKLLRDQQSGELYVIRSTSYRDASGKPVAVIVLAQSLLLLEGLLWNFAQFGVLCGIGLIVLSAAVLYRSRWYRFISAHPVPEQIIPVPTHVSFLKKESMLDIDGQKIPIPYSTNQYYLCEAVFSAPKKRWELDELLEKFGVESSREQWRKVYDAMMLINKKVAVYLPEKLIVHQEKTYRLNPTYVRLIPT